MGADMELHRLVDLALRSPDAGVVNFNHLHTLLHAILNHIGLSYDPLSGAINTKLAASPDEEIDKSAKLEQSTGEDKAARGDLSNLADKPSEVFRDRRATSELERSNYISLQRKQEILEKKVQELENRFKILDNPPSNQYIIEQAQQGKNLNQDEATTQNTLSGMWQLMKFNKRLQATEEAMDRVMTILNEFLGSDGKAIGGLKSDIEDVTSELRNLKETFLQQTRTGDNNLEQKSLAKSMGEGDSMARLNLLEKQLSGFVTKDELSVYVKWPALEKALNVKKTDLEKSNNKYTERNVLEENSLQKSDHFESKNGAPDTEPDGRPQTAPSPSTYQTPIPTPECPKTAFTRSTQVNTQELLPTTDYPSQEMVECLRQIGELSDKQSLVEKHVASIVESQQEMAGELAKVEQALPQKVSKGDLNIPDDLQEQLAMLKQSLQFLNTNQDLVALAEIKNMALNNKEHVEGIKRELAIIARQNKPAFTGVVTQTSPGIDSSVLDAIREHLTDLQTEQEKLALTADRQHSEVVQDLSRKQEHIEALYSYVEKLQESKADKENVALEMNIKADKAALDSKVNVSTFDNTFNMLDEGLREALQKMDDYMNEEMALKQALKQLSVDMSEKMDGQAFQALKNYLERRIADVQKSRNLIAAETKVDFSDAAGFRKPIKFNCISCSRPVELPLRGPLQSNLPAPRGVRTKRSKGPYLSYEMDQIRQYQRGHYGGGKGEKTLNEIISGRPCGGSHTVMYHPKRRSKTTQLNQVLGAREEAPEIPNWGRELSVIDMLKGSDGHVYKGRFRQTIPPIPKNPHSPPHEHELSFTKEESLPTSQRSSSGPSSPRNAGAGQAAEEISREPRHRPRDPQQMNGSHSTSPRTRMRHIVKHHSSDSPPAPVPSPSPPTVRENESHKVLLKQQRREESQSKLFIPAVPRPSPDGAGENEDIDQGGTGNNTHGTPPSHAVQLEQPDEVN